MNWNASSSPLSPEVASLSEAQRSKKVEEWTASGQAEHASIASFALFAQKLLAIGAPAALVTEAMQCAQEEVTHAAFAFSLASAYAGINSSTLYLQFYSLKKYGGSNFSFRINK